MSNPSIYAAEENRGYARTMRIIHWLMALMMLYIIIVGFLMGNGFKVGKHYDWHRATGWLIFFLVIIRLVAYRFTTPPSDLPVAMAPLQKTAAHVVHFLLYSCLLIQPLLGWYATNAWGVAKIPFFFGYSLPRIAEKNRELGNQLLECHYYLGLLITALVVVHILAALMHQFVWKDNLIRRMVKT